MKKTFIAVALFAALTGSLLTGCSDNSTPPATPPADAASKTNKVPDAPAAPAAK